MKAVHFSVAKKIVLVSFIAFTFFHCKNKEENVEDINVEDTSETDNTITPTLEKGCYMYNENGSFVNMEIIKNENPIEGDLIYAYAEKDKNIGKFIGELKDDKLIGTYTFQSEGVESKRQVAFMLKDNQLVEGYGELTDDGTMFKDVNSISYSSTMPLTKINCPEL